MIQAHVHMCVLGFILLSLLQLTLARAYVVMTYDEILDVLRIINLLKIPKEKYCGNLKIPKNGVKNNQLPLVELVCQQIETGSLPFFSLFLILPVKTAIFWSRRHSKFFNL